MAQRCRGDNLSVNSSHIAKGRQESFVGLGACSLSNASVMLERRLRDGSLPGMSWPAELATTAETTGCSRPMRP